MKINCPTCGKEFKARYTGGRGSTKQTKYCSSECVRNRNKMLKESILAELSVGLDAKDISETLRVSLGLIYSTARAAKIQMSKTQEITEMLLRKGLNIRGRQSDIAGMLGITRQTVQKVAMKLKRQGML